VGFENERSGSEQVGAIGEMSGVAKHSPKGTQTMAKSCVYRARVPCRVRIGDGVDLIRESVRMVMQELIEAEATERIGPARYERSASRTTDRISVRDRLLATQAGDDVELRIPKLPEGLVLPGHPRTAATHRPGAVCGGD
jgi:putative transposase